MFTVKHEKDCDDLANHDQLVITTATERQTLLGHPQTCDHGGVGVIAITQTRTGTFLEQMKVVPISGNTSLSDSGSLSARRKSKKSKRVASSSSDDNGDDNPSKKSRLAVLERELAQLKRDRARESERHGKEVQRLKDEHQSYIKLTQSLLKKVRFSTGILKLFTQIVKSI